MDELKVRIEPDEDHRRHEEVIQLADDALSEAQQAIANAREKLRIAQRNYDDRMRAPHVGS